MKRSELQQIIREEVAKATSKQTVNEAKERTIDVKKLKEMRKQLAGMEVPLRKVRNLLSDFDEKDYEAIVGSDMNLSFKEMDKLRELLDGLQWSIYPEYIDVYIKGGGAVVGGKYGSRTVNEE